MSAARRDVLESELHITMLTRLCNVTWMSNRRFLCLFMLLLLHVSGPVHAWARPNIVLILCDDLGYGDVGFNGSKEITTPELDRLAKAGPVCTSAYVVHPFCGPSRMGL